MTLLHNKHSIFEHSYSPQLRGGKKTNIGRLSWLYPDPLFDRRRTIHLIVVPALGRCNRNPLEYEKLDRDFGRRRLVNDGPPNGDHIETNPGEASGTARSLS